MNIVNFSGHELSDIAVKQIEEKFAGQDLVIETIKVGLSRSKPLFTQIIGMMRNVKTNLNSGSQPVVILPGLPIAAALILAYIHGVSGRFPKVIELLRNQDSIWETHDVHDLEFYRHGSRKDR